MISYNKQVHNLYMPKADDKKRAELEQAIAKLKHKPRESKPTEDYLDYVRK